MVPGHDGESGAQRPRALVATLHLVAVVLLALAAYVRTLPPTPTAIPEPGTPEANWWGIWPVTYLPTWAFWGGVALVGLSIARFWWGELRLPPQASARVSSQAQRDLDIPWPALALISVILVGLFFLFPIAHTRWGDAFMLAKGIAYTDPALRLTHSWQAPLAVFLHSQVWLVFHERFNWDDAVPVYRLLSPLAGGIYLAAVLGVCRLRWLAPAWLSFGLLATLGVMQLFFGYVENYSFAAAGVAIYLWLGLRALHGRAPLWLVATALAVTNAIHPSTVILAPSLLYLGWRVWRLGTAGERNRRGWRVVMEVALPMLVIGGATFWWMEASGHGLAALFNTDRPGGGDGRWFVPLFAATTRWEHYTMLSWPHLRDWVNEQILVAPVVLPALLVLAGFGWSGRRQWSKAAPVVFLAVASGAYLLFTFVWNPDYGGQRDWDLFSLAAVPTALLLVALAPLALRGRWLRGGFAPLILLQAGLLMAWVYQNTLPWQWPD